MSSNDQDGFHAEGHSADFAEAMNLWVRLTGIDKLGRSMSLRSWDIVSMHQELVEALELDPTDATAFLLLEGFREDYFRQRSFSLEELVADPEGTSAYITDVARLRGMLREPGVVEIGDHFTAVVARGLQSYGIDRPDVDAVIADRFQLGLLRRDALRSMRDLRVDQFLRGDPEPADYRPVRHRQVHVFWNVNSLLRAACTMPSGVMMALVRDPDAYQSYFVFAVRNGGNLFLVSDAPQSAHPLQRYTRRRPDRELDRRAARNWFPYSLMGLAHDEEGEAYVQQVNEGALVPLRNVCAPLKGIAELGPEEVIWSAMMLDLLAARYFREELPERALSYTGEMVRVRDSLTASPGAKLLPVKADGGLEAPPLTVADVRSGTVAESAVGEHGGRPNQWLEDRYADRVPDEALNIVALPNQGHLLVGPDDGKRTGNPGQALTTGARVVAGKAGHRFLGEGRDYELRAFDPTSFGPAEGLLADRVFVARHNLALGIQRLADAEYEARRTEVAEWYAMHVRRNLEGLLPLACRGDGFKLFREKDDEWYFGNDHGGRSRTHVVQVHDLEDKSSDRHLYSYVPISGGFERGKGSLCVVHGTRARWQISFSPRTASDLARLAGVEISGLPDVLQNWRHEDDYRGNHLLDRVDPMAWALRSPWQRMTLRVGLFLSQRAMLALRKKHGMDGSDRTV